MIKRILVVLLIASAAFVSCEKEDDLGSVQGVVVDTNKSGIADVTVSLIGSKDSLVTTTDSNGKFEFKGVKSHLFTVKTHKRDFFDAEQFGTFRESKSKTCDFMLISAALNGYVFLSLHTLEVPSQGYKTTIDVYTNTEVTFVNTLNWVSTQLVKAADNTISLKLDIAENTLSVSRTGYIIFRNDYGESDSCKITQWAKE